MLNDLGNTLWIGNVKDLNEYSVQGLANLKETEKELKKEFSENEEKLKTRKAIMDEKYHKWIQSCVDDGLSDEYIRECADVVSDDYWEEYMKEPLEIKSYLESYIPIIEHLIEIFEFYLKNIKGAENEK